MGTEGVVGAFDEEFVERGRICSICWPSGMRCVCAQGWGPGERQGEGLEGGRQPTAGLTVAMQFMSLLCNY